ncbi:TolC family protein [Mucilaginibacter myungsuensis]
MALCLLATGARAQEKISLQKAVDLALQNNLTIKQAQNNELFDAATYKQSKNNMLPSLNGSINASENFGRALDVTTYQYTTRPVFAVNPSISAQVTLFQGGLLRNQILQNKLQLEVDRSQTAKAKNDLILNVVIQYLQILTNMDLVTAAKQQIDITKLTLDRTQKTVNAGNQTIADLSQATAGQSTAELNLTNAENQLALSILTLKQYMEMPPNTEIIIERPDISKITDVRSSFNVDEVVATSLNVNPDIKLAIDQQEVSKQSIRIAKAGYYPTLSLFSNLTSNYSDVNKQKQTGTAPFIDTIGYLRSNPSETVLRTGRAAIFGNYPFGDKIRDNFAQAVGVSLQIPIFNRWNAHTNVKKAQITYENARISTEIAKRTLTKTINQAILDARAAERQYQSAQQTFKANQDAFRVIRLRYEQGLENSLNFNTSQTNLNKSEFDMIQARYNMIFRSKVIDYYLGNPISL